MGIVGVHPSCFRIKIIPLTKELVPDSIVDMEVSSYRLFDLEAAFDFRSTFRKSLLTEATSFLVGTFCSSLFLASFSIGGSL